VIISGSKTKKANWPGIVQRPVNAGSRKLGVKTARPNVDYYRPHLKQLACTS